MAIRHVILLPLGALLLAVLAASARADDEECLGCHGDRATLADVMEAGSRTLDELLVDAERFHASVHTDLGCTDCHSDFDYPHGEEAETVRCVDCHDDAATAFARSVHGGDSAAGLPIPCSACHGLHDVRRPTDRDSRLHPLNVTRTCGACHFDIDTSTATNADLLKERYSDDMHGHALLGAGLVGAPTCVTCHGGHEVLRPADHDARVHPDHVSETCGQCHLGIYERYSKSIHGMTPRGHAEDNANGREPATCTDCHKPHAIVVTDEHFKLQIIKTCSGCHGNRGNTYRGTYHGRVSEIGFGGVASCDDCHTAHEILPSSDPRSSVNPANRRDTCARCHGNEINEGFTTYLVHADPDDRAGFPVLFWARSIMRWLIFVTWAVWGIHTLLWLFRAVKDRQALRAHVQPLSGRWYRRWPWSYRAIHLTLVVSFLLLAATGLPLRFSEARWAGGIFSLFGGPENVRFMHRFGAFLTFGYTLAFLGMIVARRLRGEKGMLTGPYTLVPRVKDLQDMKANLRWFVKGGEPPRFGRWTYYEKFDFLAEVWGVGFIGITGLIMWAPNLFTAFLPGSVINLAHILHSYEALLATTFIFTMHFFNANLRPGKFPVDTMFLHGRISEEELKHERPEEYELMRQDGRLESEALPPPNERIVGRARVIGIGLISVGLILLVLMVSTML